jgi:hypothetical protein
MPLQEIVEAAAATGVRWVCLTDHTNPAVASGQPRGGVGGVLVIPGEEITAWSSAIHSLGTDGSIVKRGQDFAAFDGEITRRGGVAALGHLTHFPFRPPYRMAAVAAYDLSDDYRAVPWLSAPAALAALGSADPATAAESFLLHVQTRQDAHREMWDAYLAGGPMGGFAETNAHGKFRWFGVHWDNCPALFGLVRNHALVPRVDEDAVLEAVARGRLHWSFDGTADGSGARFEAWRAGRPVAAMGDSLPDGPGVALVVHLPVPASVTVLRDGRPWRTGRGRVLAFPAEGPGVYRAEADLRVAGAGRPWVVFNPVRIEAAAP